MLHNEVLKNMHTNNKEKLLAVVGVSHDPTKYGYRIFTDLLKNGYHVIGVNPKGGSVENHTLYPSLTELPTVPEVVIVVVPPMVGCLVLKECAQLGIDTVWMQPGAESPEAQNLARQLGIKLTTACFMVHEHIW